MTCLWPIGAWIEAIQATKKSPRETSTGRLWRTAIRHNLPVREVLFYGADRPESPCADAWICQFETVRTLPSLNAKEAIQLAWDKSEFSRFCLSNGLPAIMTLAEWRDGTRSGIAAQNWPDHVVLKPVFSSKGAGVEPWRREGDGFRSGQLGLSEHAFEAHAASLSAYLGPVLVQPRLVPHSRFVAAGMSGMPIARLVTGCWPDGSAELLEAFWVAPAAGQFASNSGGEHVWLIDQDAGTITQTPTDFYAPWTGPDVSGLALPDWDDAVSATLGAHRAFPSPCVAIGWDVGFTTQGPVLIEANTGISSTLDQTLRQRPSGPERMGQLIDAWLRKLE